MSLLDLCARQLLLALEETPAPPGVRWRVEHAPGQLRFEIVRVDDRGEPLDVATAEFAGLPEREPAVAPSGERLALWARVFLRAQLEEPPARTAANPALVLRAELADDDAMLEAMRDPDYGLFAQQISEAEGDEEACCVEAVRSGNWLWLGDLLARNPSLATRRPDGESLLTVAAECPEPGAARVIELLLMHGAEPDREDEDGAPEHGEDPEDA
jgi:hypothetical protein